MRINTVHLKNIRSYEDERIEFPAGTTLLAGDIGCGKSTILQSIEFALFGLHKGELEGTDLLRHGKNSGSVRVDMEIGGHQIIIERTLKRSKNIMQDASSIVIDNRREDIMPTELKSKVLEMLGYSQALLKKNKPLFRFTVYTPQEEMKKILYDKEDRLDTLRNLFNIDKYSAIRNNGRIFMTELRRTRTGLEGELKIVQTDVSRMGEYEDSREALLASIVDQKSLAAAAGDRCDSKKADLDAKKRAFAELSAARHQQARKEAELVSKRRRFDQIKSDISELESRMENYAQIASASPKLDIEQLKIDLAEAEKKRDHLVSAKAVYGEGFRKLHKIYSEGVCEVCGQKVHNAEEFLMHVTEIRQKYEASEAEISSSSATCTALKTSISSAERAAQYESLLHDASERNSRLTAEMDYVSNDIIMLDREVQALRARTEGYDDASKEISSIEEEFYELQKVKSEAERVLARYEQQLSDVDKRIAEMQRKITQAEALQQKITRISEMTAWFDRFYALMEAMEKHVMISIQKEFNQYFQKWFSVLMDDQINVHIDETFSPVIEQNGYVTEYENLSGGEKTSVALAYRLALNRVINDIIETIRTKDLLILDEPTDGFSTDQLDRIRNVINELRLGQIIIVSHEPKIDTYVDNVIRIYKENHVSRVAS